MEYFDLDVLGDFDSRRGAAPTKNHDREKHRNGQCGTSKVHFFPDSGYPPKDVSAKEWDYLNEDSEFFERTSAQMEEDAMAANNLESFSSVYGEGSKSCLFFDWRCEIAFLRRKRRSFTVGLMKLAHQDEKQFQVYRGSEKESLLRTTSQDPLDGLVNRSKVVEHLYHPIYFCSL